MLLALSQKLRRTIFSPMPNGCAIQPFGPKACISAVELPKLLVKLLFPLVPNDPVCDGLLMVWMRFWLYGLLCSTSLMTLSGINLSNFWLLDDLQLFHTPPSRTRPTKKNPAPGSPHLLPPTLRLS